MPQWCPKNYDAGSAAGPSTLRFGIEKSRNLMTVRLAHEIGMPIIVEYAKRFGVYDNLMPALSMALGAGETTVMRMVTGYSMIANGGKQIKATFIDRIQDRYGRTVWRHDGRDCANCAARQWSGQQEPQLVDDRKQVLDPMSAYQMVSIMEGVVQSGTAQRLKVLKRPVAGKTGTTNDYKDAWFVGFTPDLVGRRLYRLRPAGLHGPWRDRRQPRRAGGARLCDGGAERRAAGAVPRPARHQAGARQPQDPASRPAPATRAPSWRHSSRARSLPARWLPRMAPTAARWPATISARLPLRRRRRSELPPGNDRALTSGTGGLY